MDTSNLTFRNGACHFFTVKYCGLVSVSQPNMWVQVTSTMDQRWINNVLLAPTLPPLAAPDDSVLFELAPPPLRKRDQDKRTETEKRKSHHRNRERKSERTRDLDY